MFDSLLQSIYKKLKATKDANKRAEGLKKLEEAIAKNKIYKHQFENIMQVREAKDKKAAIKEANARNEKFIAENKMCCCQVSKANKKLAEFFNINTKGLKKSKLDEAIQVKGKSPKSVIKESFTTIHKAKDAGRLHTQLRIIEFLSEGINKKEDKDFITASVLKLRQLKESNFKNAVEKAYKLRLIVEKKLREFAKDDNMDAEQGKYPGQVSPGKKVALKDLALIKDIEISVPYNYTKPEKIIFSFIIPFYPSGVYNEEIRQEIKSIKKKMDRLERLFINKTIYQAGRDRLFNPVGTIWDSMMDDGTANAKPGRIAEYKIDVYIATTLGEATWKEYYTEAYKMLDEFQSILQQQFTTELDRAFQQKELKRRKDEIGKRKKYVRRKDNEGTYNGGLDDKYDGYFD